jgi:hypothetical protein
MRKITLQEHIVASASEMRELELQGDITLYEPKNERHKFFHNIKSAPYRTYQGRWGTEHIKWDGEGAAIVRATDSRAREIKHYISDCLFGNHNE